MYTIATREKKVEHHFIEALENGASLMLYSITDALWGRCFTSISFAHHVFLLDRLKLNLALLLDQLRLA